MVSVDNRTYKTRTMMHYQKPVLLEGYHVTAIDASDVFTKGAVKQTFHLHYAVDLFSLNCSQFKLTGQNTGETLKNFVVKKKDRILADRAYATITGIEYCMGQGVDFILRINPFTSIMKGKNKFF